MSVDVWAETEQTLISRVHGTTQDATDKRRASVVLYCNPSVTAAHVAAQLRGAADELERPSGRIPSAP
jgi:hypothetical protein